MRWLQIIGGNSVLHHVKMHPGKGPQRTGPKEAKRPNIKYLTIKFPHPDLSLPRPFFFSSKSLIKGFLTDSLFSVFKFTQRWYWKCVSEGFQCCSHPGGGKSGALCTELSPFPPPQICLFTVGEHLHVSCWPLISRALKWSYAEGTCH